MSNSIDLSLLKRRPVGRLLFRSGGGVAGVKVANAVLGLGTVTLFAGFLSPEGFGVYVLAITIAQFVALPLLMGMPTLLNREIAIAVADGNLGVVRGITEWSCRNLVKGSLILAMVVILAFGLIRIFELPVFTGFRWPLVVLTVVLIPVIAVLKQSMGILAGLKHPALSRVLDGLIRPVLLLVFGCIGVLLLDITHTGLLLVYLVCALVTALISIRLVYRLMPQGFSSVKPVLLSSVWWKSLLPLTFLSAAAAIKTHTDILMLGFLSTSSDVAFYKVATQIAALPLVAQMAVNVVIAPWVAAMYAKHDLAGVQRVIVQGSRLAFAVSFLSALVIAGIGSALFASILGDAYSPVYFLTVALAFGSSATAFFGSTVLILSMIRREKNSLRFSIWTALANVALNMLLIPVYGVMGAVFATVLTNVAMQFLCWNVIRRDVGLRSDAFGKFADA